MGVDELVTGGDVDDPVVDSLTTEEGTITNETFVVATRSSSTGSSAFASGEYAQIADTEVKDARDELNSSFQFVPDETAYYRVDALVYINKGNSSDALELRVQNVTDGVTVERLNKVAHSQNFTDVSGSKTMELTAGKNYEIQATDTDGSWGLIGDAGTTRFSVVKEVVQP